MMRAIESGSGEGGNRIGTEIPLGDSQLEPGGVSCGMESGKQESQATEEKFRQALLEERNSRVMEMGERREIGKKMRESGSMERGMGKRENRGIDAGQKIHGSRGRRESHEVWGKS